MSDRRPYRAPAALGASALLVAAAVLACVLLLVLWRVLAPTLAEEPRVRVGLVAAPEQEPLALALAGGAIDPARLTVVEFASFEDLHGAFLDGNVHAAVFTLDEALRLSAPPLDARVLSCVGVTRTPLSLMAPAGGPDLAALRGRRIGLESGRRPMAALRELLARAGLGLADVRLRQLDVDSAPVALAHGQVDAVLVYPPCGERMQRQGARVLATWAPEAPGDLLVLVANPRARRLAGGQLARLVDAWRRGAAWSDTLTPERVALIARREQLEPAAVLADRAGVRFLGAAADRRMRAPPGRDSLLAYLLPIERRWRALGITEALPPPERWLAAPAEARP